MSDVVSAFEDVMIPVITPNTSTYAQNIAKSVMMSEIPHKDKEYILAQLTARSVARISYIDSVGSDDLSSHSIIVLDDRTALSKINVMSVLFRRHFYVCTNKSKAFVRPHVPVYGNMWTFWFEHSSRNYPAVSLFVYNCMPHYYIHTFATKLLVFPERTRKNNITSVVQCLHKAFKVTSEAIREHIAIRLAVQKRRRRFADEVNRVSMELPEYIRYMTSMGDGILSSVVESASEIVKRTASTIVSDITSTIIELINSGYSIKPVPKNFRAPDGYVPLFMIDIEIYPKTIRRNNIVYRIPEEIYKKYEINKEIYVKGLVICSYGDEYRQIALKARHPNISSSNAVCDFSASKDIRESVHKAINELQVCNLDSCYGNSAEAYCEWLVRKLDEAGVKSAEIMEVNQ